MSNDRARQRDAVGKPLPPAFVLSDHGEPYLYEVNRNAFAHEPSATIFRRYFGDALLKKDSLYVILGSDSGLLIRYLLDTGLPDGSRYLILEPPEIADLIVNQVPEIRTEPRLALATFETWEQVLDTFSVRDYIYLENFRLHRSLAATDAFYAAYPGLFQRISQRIVSIKWHVQAELGHQDFYREQLYNLGDNQTPASVLENHFGGQTAMILAGGPSLDEFIPWARLNRDRVTLIAASRVSRRLRMSGLQPHIVVSVDPNEVGAYISRQLWLFNPDEVLFAYNYHVNHLLPTQWAGRSVYMGDRLPWESPQNPPNIHDYGPTVTNAAINLALHMGFGRILLAGVDLCFNRDGYSHASGSWEREAGPLIAETELSVLTNGGRQAETRPDYLSALQHLAAQATDALERGCEIINPSMESAQVDSIKYQPLEAMDFEPPPRSPGDNICALVPVYNSEQRKKHYQRMLKELQSATYRLQQIKQMTREALKCNDGLFGRNGKQADFKYKKRMDKIERRLDRDYKDLSPLVKKYDVRQFLRLAILDRDREWTPQEIEDWGRVYYQTYRDSADELIQLIDDASMRLKARLDEERNDIGVMKLHEAWKQQKLWVRPIVWEHQCRIDKRQINPEDRQYLDDLLPVLYEYVEDQKPRDTPVRGSLADLRSIRIKSQRLFRSQDLNGLKHLDAILEHGNIDAKNHQRLLLTGYIRELEQNNQDALTAYQSILNTYNGETGEEESEAAQSVLEETLLRIAAISFNEQNLENAANTLECLSNVSPIYDRQYGELLRITGQTEAAINAYSRYVQIVPDDTQAMLRLGRMHYETCNYDAARLTCNQAMKQDQSNQEVLELLSKLPEA